MPWSWPLRYDLILLGLASAHDQNLPSRVTFFRTQTPEPEKARPLLVFLCVLEGDITVS